MFPGEIALAENHHHGKALTNIMIHTAVSIGCTSSIPSDANGRSSFISYCLIRACIPGFEVEGGRHIGHVDGLWIINLESIMTHRAVLKLCIPIVATYLILNNSTETRSPKSPQSLRTKMCKKIQFLMKSLMRYSPISMPIRTPLHNSRFPLFPDIQVWIYWFPTISLCLTTFALLHLLLSPTYQWMRWPLLISIFLFCRLPMHSPILIPPLLHRNTWNFRMGRLPHALLLHPLQ